MDIELYTRERLHTAIERMRKSTEELNRVLAILNENNARTLKDDLENFENRIAGRRLNQAYVQAVCNAFYVTTKSKLHSALLEAVVAEPTSQKLLDNMIGKYEAYWPASNDKFDKFPMEISYADDTYTVSDRTIGKSKIQFGHSGFAFLIRKRVHVVEPVESGLRSMIFHYEEMPAKNPVKGIITNILDAGSEDLRAGEQIFSAHFIAFHENDTTHFGQRIQPKRLNELLHHARNRTGVISV
ncbi:MULTISPECIES: hypothetical protein [Bradyrhizobium]|uniref:Uncharacterized protein n=1 Tax=Bradyrhizobium arachidis TaxID=858423 RepID=A0AAE7NNX7_9BRAD|nr:MULTISPECIES: hypothetical protein [Bradyrhizobium]QOZ66828.1 hypothetical protein WN72_11280 [Bradyrhizobium arachidis]SFV19412.1 hypothetical protein SAMN05192541_15029 [Bradyrhizobium arachidis]